MRQSRDDDLVKAIAPGGFLIGWQPANLGNALSCLANMFLLSARCGVPATYVNSAPLQGLFESPETWLVDPEHTFRRAGLDVLLSRYQTLFERGPEHSNHLFQALPFEEMAYRDEKGELSFTVSSPSLSDWSEGNADAHVRVYCRRGNGLVISGCYWRQYLDMRLLAERGIALKRHLGSLRVDGCVGRRQRARIEKRCDVLQIGIHFRVSHEYSTWLGGLYHFLPQETVSIIRRLHRELGDLTHTFYIFSDTPLEPALFYGLPCHLERGGAQDDFIALSDCDLVVGPPSTFASWAAFLGTAKRIVLTRERLADTSRNILSWAIELPFPNGHYLPDDPTGRTI